LYDFCKYYKIILEELKMDFIKQIACMISESTSTPSYDDIFTLCKIFDKEPDSDTMGPDEYNRLPEAEKAKIHGYIDELNNSETADIELEEIEKYIGGLKYPNADDIKFDFDVERDEEGYPLKDGKRIPKRKSAYATDDDFKKTMKKVPHVFVAESLTTFSPEKHNIENIDDIDNPKKNGKPRKPTQYQKIDRKNSWKKVGTIKFPTEEAAKEWCENRINERCSELGLDRNEFTVGHDFLPGEIKQVDPNAIGYIYLKLFGTGAVELGKRGRKSKNADAEADKEIRFETVEREVRLEYIIYESAEIIRSSGAALNDLFDAAKGKN
jgi:hypothetical protein